VTNIKAENGVGNNCLNIAFKWVLSLCPCPEGGLVCPRGGLVMEIELTIFNQTFEFLEPLDTQV